jgi:hypothetical protein
LSVNLLRPPLLSSSARLGALGALLLCTACPGELADPALFGGDAALDDRAPSLGDGGCPDIPTQLLQVDCVSSACHSAASAQGGLDLASPNVAARLVGVHAQGGGLLVDPADPAMSVLYTKLTSTPPFGAQMPLLGQPLDDAMMACVLTWISQQRVDGGLP